jgi:5-methylcytosine-specific restriction endonuclease McrA
MKRNTTRRDRHRRIIARTKADCGICNEPIDYTLPYLHPREFVADHIIPRNKGGADTLENKQAAHRDCNRAKSDSMPLPAGATFVTARIWA